MGPGIVVMGWRVRVGWFAVLVCAVVSVGVLTEAGQAAGGAGQRQASVAGKRCALHPVGASRVCLRAGQRCVARLEHAYLKARLQCRGGRLRRASLAALREGEPLLLSAHGQIPFRYALEAFSSEVARLPGIRTPPGAVGRIDDPTEVIAAVQAHRARLSRAQRAVLDRVLVPGRAAVQAATPAQEQAFAGLVSEAARRVRDHGFALNHKFSLFFPTSNKTPGGEQDALAYTAWGWLFQIPGYSDSCMISVTPAGVAKPLPLRRRFIAHEVFHCAQGEFYSSPQDFARVPQWVTEGSATWVASQIAAEWNGFDTRDGHWSNWLNAPQLDLGKRDYDGIGFWALLAQSGADVFARLHEVIPAAATGGDGSAYGAAIGLGPAAFFDLWGPGFVQTSALGPNWALSGTGILESSPPHAVISDGTQWGGFVDARGAFGSLLSLEADVITIQSEVSHGRLHTATGETPLTSEVLCTKQGGCKCDQGQLTARQTGKGIAAIGWQGGGVNITGTTLADACKKQGKGEPPTKVPHTRACTLLAQAGVIRFIRGTWIGFGNGCSGGKCLQHVEEQGQTKCEYAKGALLTVVRVGSAQRARAAVRRYIGTGLYRRINLGADLAGIATNVSGSAVVMAVGRTEAVFTMGATSDTNPHPVWHNESKTIEFAGRIARLLR